MRWVSSVQKIDQLIGWRIHGTLMGILSQQQTKMFGGGSFGGDKCNGSFGGRCVDNRFRGVDFERPTSNYRDTPLREIRIGNDPFAGSRGSSGSSNRGGQDRGGDLSSRSSDSRTWTKSNPFADFFRAPESKPKVECYEACLATSRNWFSVHAPEPAGRRCSVSGGFDLDFLQKFAQIGDRWEGTAGSAKVTPQTAAEARAIAESIRLKFQQAQDADRLGETGSHSWEPKFTVKEKQELARRYAEVDALEEHARLSVASAGKPGSGVSVADAKKATDAFTKAAAELTRVPAAKTPASTGPSLATKRAVVVAMGALEPSGPSATPGPRAPVAKTPASTGPSLATKRAVVAAMGATGSSGSQSWFGKIGSSANALVPKQDARWTPVSKVAPRGKASEPISKVAPVRSAGNAPVASAPVVAKSEPAARTPKKRGGKKGMREARETASAAAPSAPKVEPATRTPKQKGGRLRAKREAARRDAFVNSPAFHKLVASALSDSVIKPAPRREAYVNPAHLTSIWHREPGWSKRN